MKSSTVKPSAASVPRPTADQLLQKNHDATKGKTFQPGEKRLTKDSVSTKENTYSVTSGSKSRLPSQLKLVESNSPQGNSPDVGKGLSKQAKPGQGAKTDATGSPEKSRPIPLVSGSMVFPEKAATKKPKDRSSQKVGKDADKPDGAPSDNQLPRTNKKKAVSTTLIESKDVFPHKPTVKQGTKTPTDDASSKKKTKPKTKNCDTVAPDDPEHKKKSKKPKKHKNALIFPDDLKAKKLKKKIFKFDVGEECTTTGAPQKEGATNLQGETSFKVPIGPRPKEKPQTLAALLRRTEIKLKENCTKDELADLINGAMETRPKKFVMVFVVNSKLQMEVHEDSPMIISSADLLLNKLHSLPKYREDLLVWQKHGFRTYLLDGKNEKELVNVMIKANTLDIPFFASRLEGGLKGPGRIAVAALFGRVVKVQGRTVIKF